MASLRKNVEILKELENKVKSCETKAVFHFKTFCFLKYCFCKWRRALIAHEDFGDAMNTLANVLKV